MNWTQIYNPLGNLLVSALVASLPVVILLGLLAFFHVRAHLAAIAGLVISLIVAITVYGMPTPLAVAAAANGAAYGLFPIGWIVLSAIFVYDITVETGKFETVKHTVANLASDRRIQALLIAFSFGAFIEGAAGFGTPVAISAAMLIGLGFKPLQAAGLALIGNTAPVAFGALGTPIIALARVTGLPIEQLRDGRPTASILLDHRPILVGLGDGWIQGNARSVARLPGLRRELRHCAVPRQQLSRTVGSRHSRRNRLDLIDGDPAQILAAAQHMAL
jgi:L-lactate permease